MEIPWGPRSVTPNLGEGGVGGIRIGKEKGK